MPSFAPSSLMSNGRLLSQSRLRSLLVSTSIQRMVAFQPGDPNSTRPAADATICPAAASGLKNTVEGIPRTNAKLAIFPKEIERATSVRQLMTAAAPPTELSNARSPLVSAEQMASAEQLAVAANEMARGARRAEGPHDTDGDGPNIVLGDDEEEDDEPLAPKVSRGVRNGEGSLKEPPAVSAVFPFNSANTSVRSGDDQACIADAHSDPPNASDVSAITAQAYGDQVAQRTLMEAEAEARRLNKACKPGHDWNDTCGIAVSSRGAVAAARASSKMTCNEAAKSDEGVSARSTSATGFTVGAKGQLVKVEPLTGSSQVAQSGSAKAQKPSARSSSMMAQAARKHEVFLQVRIRERLYAWLCARTPRVGAVRLLRSQRATLVDSTCARSLAPAFPLVDAHRTFCRSEGGHDARRDAEGVRDEAHQREAGKEATAAE